LESSKMKRTMGVDSFGRKRTTLLWVTSEIEGSS